MNGLNCTKCIAMFFHKCGKELSNVTFLMLFRIPKSSGKCPVSSFNSYFLCYLYFMCYSYVISNDVISCSVLNLLR